MPPVDFSLSSQKLLPEGSFVNAHFVGVSAGSAEKEAGTGAAKCVRGALADQSLVTEGWRC